MRCCEDLPASRFVHGWPTGKDRWSWTFGRNIPNQIIHHQIMFFIVLGAWLTGIVVSLVNHNRKLPLSILGIGTFVLVGHFTVGFGFVAVAVMAILSVIIWIANKLDMG
jgi:hypothetical protein